MLVKQTIGTQNDNSLLDYAVSRLSPDIFLHPVWVRFGKEQVSNSPHIVRDLVKAAKSIQETDPSGACQILLLCAIFQNHADQPDKAQKTILQAAALAERFSLARETIWTIWGACAISYQLGNYEEAIKHLSDLQAIFDKSNEWVLANLIDVLRQSIFQPISVPVKKNWQSPQTQPFGDALALIIVGLSHWGFSHEASEVKPETVPIALKSQNSQSLSSNLVSPVEEIVISPNTTPVEKLLQPSLGSEKHKASIQTTDVIPLAVHMLGTFNITINDLTLKLPASRGLSLLKYLLLQHKQYIPREVLMDIFWPDAELETARNSLNVAIYSLRRALHSYTELPLVIFEDGAYGIAPRFKIWLDVEEFEQCLQAGQRLEEGNQRSAAIAEYETAISLYQGDFLEQNPYEEWTIPDRERLRVAYLDTLERLSQIYFIEERYSACRTACQLILTEDPCREDAHCLLMRCYSRQRQPHLALYQYQRCVEALRSELDVVPAPETKQLYDTIRRHEYV